MKILNFSIILVFCTAAGALCAEPAAMTVTNIKSSTTCTTGCSKNKVDLTQEFFLSLAKCRSGEYSEKNILSSILGNDLLQHTIDGLNDNICSATLGTPDGRKLRCTFNIDDLGQLSDMHFINGILSDTLEDPQTESIRADLLWNEIKSKSCSF